MRIGTLIALVLGLVLVGCGPAEEEVSEPETPAVTGTETEVTELVEQEAMRPVLSNDETEVPLTESESATTTDVESQVEAKETVAVEEQTTTTVDSDEDTIEE
jgi:hypothetical protein